MSQKFRCKIHTKDLTYIKQGLEIQKAVAKDPKNPDFDKLKELNDLTDRLDHMATRYHNYYKEIETNMAGSDQEISDGQL